MVRSTSTLCGRGCISYGTSAGEVEPINGLAVWGGTALARDARTFRIRAGGKTGVVAELALIARIERGV